MSGIQILLPRDFSASVAQQAEQGSFKSQVVGSKPTGRRSNNGAVEILALTDRFTTNAGAIPVRAAYMRS